MHQEPTSRKRAVSVERIAVPKPHHVLSDHLRYIILRGEIPEGESLPSERDLVEQTGLSRGAVRQALRTLSEEGLVETRHGRLGGSIVRLPGNDSMVSAISRFVQGRRIPLRTLQETRDVLEPFLARLAAERRTSEQLNELKKLHEELVASAQNFREFSMVNLRWHNAIARASGNELLATLLYSVSHGLEIATMVQEYDTLENRRQVINIHARINEAIECGDSQKAERSMRLHMSATHSLALTPPSTEIPLTKQSLQRPIAIRRPRQTHSR